MDEMNRKERKTQKCRWIENKTKRKQFADGRANVESYGKKKIKTHFTQTNGKISGKKENKTTKNELRKCTHATSINYGICFYTHTHTYQTIIKIEPQNQRIDSKAIYIGFFYLVQTVFLAMTNKSIK